MIKLQLNLPGGFKAYQKEVGVILLFDSGNEFRVDCYLSDGPTERNIGWFHDPDLIEAVDITYDYLDYCATMTQISASVDKQPAE